MNRLRRIAHVFVDFIPDKLEEGRLYVSIRFATAAHKCCCGCGLEVTTPISPVDWKLTYDGETVSLDPSIGNWSFPCQSHYWIERNNVIWARRWSRRRVEAVRDLDRAEKQEYLGGKERNEFREGTKE